MMSLSRPLTVVSVASWCKWFGRPQSGAIWITEDELHKLNLAMLEWYLQDNSPESSSFPAGEYDANRYHTKSYSTGNGKFKNLGMSI